MDYIYCPNKNDLHKTQSSSRTLDMKAPARKRYHPVKMPIHLPRIPLWQVGVIIAIPLFAYGLFSAVTGIKSNRQEKIAAMEAEAINAQAQEETKIKETVVAQISSPEDALSICQQKIEAKDLKAAVVACEKGVEMRPNWRDANLLLAAVRLAQNNTEKALTAAEAAVALDPIYPPSYTILAQIYTKSGNDDKAKIASDKADSLATITGTQTGGL